MKIRILLSILAAALIAAGCSGPSEPRPFEFELIEVTTGGHPSSPRLEAGPDSQVILSWIQTEDHATSLEYSRFTGDSWGAAATASRSDRMFVNWADLPSVVPLSDTYLAAHWMVLSNAHPHAYNIAFSESRDGGESWSTPITPHRDGTDSEHGFVSIYANDGKAELLWLDGRKTVNPDTTDPVANGMTLRSSDHLVDELVCDCCQTDVAIASSGPIAVYRDRSVDEVRDIYVTRLIDGRWQTGTAVAQDGWRISGCPVNGPSITADGDLVAVGWFTAASQPHVQLAFSSDSGQSFSAPIEVVAGATLGRVATAYLDDGAVAISWLETVGSGSTAVKVRRVNSDGSLGTIREISGSASTFLVPQMLRHDTDLIFAWAQGQGDARTVVSARLAINSL